MHRLGKLCDGGVGGGEPHCGAGWSKTLFILAHELPQEVGDYGILIGSGFGTWQALGFNFLSALVALAGTGLALAVGARLRHPACSPKVPKGAFAPLSSTQSCVDMRIHDHC